MANLVVRLPGKHDVLGSNPYWCVTFLAENIQVLAGVLLPLGSLPMRELK